MTAAALNPSSVMTEDRLDWHLDNWTAYQHRKTHKRELGLSRSGMVFVNSIDFDAMVGAVDLRCADAVEAIIGSWPAALRCAVWHVHLAAVFRFRIDPMAAYLIAREGIREGLADRGIA